MDTDELFHILSDVAGAKVSVDAGLVVARVPAIDDAVRLDPADVLSAYEIVVPTGDAGVEFGIRRGRQELPLIVTAEDVVFMPADAADMVRPGAILPVPAGPDLVAYSEMHRDMRALGRAIDQPGVDLDTETLAATLLMHRCFLAGALRVGLRPVRVAAWWEYTWASKGGGLLLPAFRADPAWDQLMAAVAEARRRTTTEQQAS
jgi:hypothetical protein